MSFSPFMWSIFCDDVRQEAGNKLSFMGIYGPTLIVETWPTTLVKLCCVMSVRLPASATPRTVVFRLLTGKEVLFDAAVSHPELQDPPDAPAKSDIDAAAVTISTAAQLINFQITQRCHLRAVAIADGMELHGGTLELLATSSTQRTR